MRTLRSGNFLITPETLDIACDDGKNDSRTLPDCFLSGADPLGEQQSARAKFAFDIPFGFADKAGLETATRTGPALSGPQRLTQHLHPLEVTSFGEYADGGSVELANRVIASGLPRTGRLLTTLDSSGAA